MLKHFLHKPRFPLYSVRCCNSLASFRDRFLPAVELSASFREMSEPLVLLLNYAKACLSFEGPAGEPVGPPGSLLGVDIILRYCNVFLCRTKDWKLANVDGWTRSPLWMCLNDDHTQGSSCSAEMEIRSRHDLNISLLYSQKERKTRIWTDKRKEKGVIIFWKLAVRLFYFISVSASASVRASFMPTSLLFA